MNILNLDVKICLLYNLSVKDVLNFCKTNREMTDVIDSYDFWVGYIDKKYGISHLGKTISVKDEYSDIGEIIRVLSDELVDIFAKNINVYLAATLYVENSKLITYMYKQDGFPFVRKQLLLSKYSTLGYIFNGNTVSRNIYLYSSNKCLYIDNDEIKVLDLSDISKSEDIDLKYLDHKIDQSDDWHVFHLKDIIINGSHFYDTVDICEDQQN